MSEEVLKGRRMMIKKAMVNVDKVGTEARGETFYPGRSRIHLAATRYSTGAVATAFKLK